MNVETFLDTSTWMFIRGICEYAIKIETLYAGLISCNEPLFLDTVGEKIWSYWMNGYADPGVC